MSTRQTLTIKHDSVPFKASDEQIQFVRENAHLLTSEKLADFLGIARRTLFKAFDRDPDLQKAWIEAKTRGLTKVASALYKTAIEGNVAAQTFYLKCRGGWRQGDGESEQATDTVRSIDDLYSDQGDNNGN